MNSLNIKKYIRYMKSNLLFGGFPAGTHSHKGYEEKNPPCGQNYVERTPFWNKEND